MNKIISLLALLSLALIFMQCGKDGDDDPVITVTTADFTASIDENPAAGAVIGTVTGSTNSGSVSFSLTSDNPSGALSVNGSSGQLTVADAALFDFETNPSITGTVEVFNGSVKQVSNITITVIDVDDSPPTIWSGATLTFSKGDSDDPNMAANQDRISDKVWITRANNGGQIYNAVTENAANQNTSPAGTEWALGTTTNFNSLTFGNFRSVGTPKNIVGKDLVLKLVEEDILIDIKFTAWSQGGQSGDAGGFTYERSTAN